MRALVALGLMLLCGCENAMPLSGSRVSDSAVKPLTAYKLLYSFKGNPDGAFPTGLVTVGGDLYGTTTLGGSGCGDGSVPGCGTVFKSTLSGAETIIYRFKNLADGVEPSGLVVVNGIFYGTTFDGGTGCSAQGCGTLFKMSPSGKKEILYRFKGGADGAIPSGSLLMLTGSLYGTTAEGGGSGCLSFGCGTIYKASLSGQERVIYRFKGNADGSSPNGTLIASDDVLYGTTALGGKCNVRGGCGTVFKSSLSGKHAVLYSFKGSEDKGPDGGYPAAGLLALNGTLYGTTLYGGSASCFYGPTCGTVFSVSKAGVEHVLHRFEGAPDGAWPLAALTSVSGLLYGVTSGGGACSYHQEGCGTLFTVTPSSKERVVYDFQGDGSSTTDGSSPAASLLLLNGQLYGSTQSGGTSTCGPSGTGCGTLFRFLP